LVDIHGGWTFQFLTPADFHKTERPPRGGLSHKFDEAFGLHSDSRSLPLPAPTEQTQPAEAGLP
jgi:hypothetical protein